jgi:hypothetical protein
LREQGERRETIGGMRTNAWRGHRPRALAVGGLALLVLAAAGCSREEVAHYRVPKTSAAAAQATPAAMARDVAAPPRPAQGTALRWTLPARWTEETGQGGMRYATLKAPIAGRLDVSVTVLPGPAGGELANVNRWRGQIGLPNLDEAGLAAARRVMSTKAGPLAVYDFTSEGQKRSRLVAGLATVEGNTWFVKMTGDAPAVERARPDFLRILGSLRLEASN